MLYNQYISNDKLDEEEHNDKQSHVYNLSWIIQNSVC